LIALINAMLIWPQSLSLRGDARAGLTGGPSGPARTAVRAHDGR